MVYMKTLFICHANVGRSQAAMELFRQRGGDADSAGTNVDAPGATLAERPTAKTIVDIMREDHNIDMINNIRTQLTKEKAEEYDRLIVMAEPETWPEWLKHDPRMTYWEIQDTKGQDMPTTRMLVGQIYDKIQDLQP